MAIEWIVFTMSLSLGLAVAAIFLAVRLNAGTRASLRGMASHGSEIDSLKKSIMASLENLDVLIDAGKKRSEAFDAETIRQGLAESVTKENEEPSQSGLSDEMIEAACEEVCTVPAKEADAVRMRDLLVCEMFASIIEQTKRLLDRVFVLEYGMGYNGLQDADLGTAMFANREVMYGLETAVKNWRDRLQNGSGGKTEKPVEN